MIIYNYRTFLNRIISLVRNFGAPNDMINLNPIPVFGAYEKIEESIMYRISNSTKLRKLPSAIIFIISLSACQSISPVDSLTGNVASSDAESQSGSQFEGSILDSVSDSIIEVFSDLYARGAIVDYMGDVDKQNIIKATQKAADTGQLQIFTNPESGVQGKAEVVKSVTLPTQEEGKEDGVRECKTIRQTIVLKDGREITENVTTCKGPDGWS